MSASFKEELQKSWADTIINAMRKEKKITKSQLCSQLGISITTVNSILTKLISDGIVVHNGIRDSIGGRKAELFSLDADCAYFVGLEFSAAGVTCAVLNMKREIHYKEFVSFNGDESAELLISTILSELHNAENSVDSKGKIKGIAIGASGYSEYDRGLVVFYTPNPHWNNVALMDVLNKEFSYPIYMWNNVNLMPYATKWVLNNGVCDDHVILVVRHGFKMATYSGNYQIKGSHNFAGEIGHMHVNGSNRMCHCGKYGCYDTEVTYPAIYNKIEEGISVGRFNNIMEKIKSEGNFNIKFFTDACNSGDKDCLDLMYDTILHIADALSWIFYIADPSVIYIVSMLDSYKDFYKKIQECLYDKHENNFTYGKFHVLPAPFGKYLGAVGAAAYVYEQCFGMIY